MAPLPDEAVEPFARHLARVLGVPAAALFLKHGEHLFLHCGVGLPERIYREGEIPYFFQTSSTISPHVMINDTNKSGLTSDCGILTQLGWRSVACMQFVLNTGATALLCAADVKPHSWTDRDSALLTDVAGLILKQVRREVRAREDAAHNRTLEDVRRQLEQRYRRLFEGSRDAIFMTAPDDTFTDANPSMLEMFGYTQEELQQLKSSDLYVDDDERARYRVEIEKSGSVRQHEVQLKRKDGTVLDCLKTASAQRGKDGEIVGYQGIIHDISDRKRVEERLAHNALHDSLTDLPNRSLFMDRLERVVRYTIRHPDSAFAVLFLDIDRFKIVNDTMGHMAGDQLLTSVARRLEGCIRLEDTVGRLGGDEFAIIVNSVRDASDATRVAERVIQELSLPFTIDGKEINTGVSVGVALSYSSNRTADSILRDADAAMYRAKATGRGRYQVFDPLLHTEAVTRLQIETDLRRALQTQEFALVYQPVIDLRDESLAGFEVFLRWEHPVRGTVSPAEFIGVAEETGLILPIGWWVLEEACRQVRRWQDEYRDELGSITVSINVSGKQFYQPDLVQHVEQILAETGASPAHVKLEVPENVIMRNAESSVRILQQLRQRGILLSIDDFGTGFSSLRYLQQFPVTTLKIDHSFVATLLENTQPGLVSSIIALGHSFGIDALAEGVETAEQAARLTELGTRFAQGYHFSAPVDAERAALFILSRRVQRV